MNTKNKAVLLAILAASCYGISSPISKILLVKIPPTLMAALLYLGAGFGMAAVSMLKDSRHAPQTEAKITKKEMAYIIGMIILDIAAPVFLMLGLTLTNSADVSLLNNFETVATSIIALLIFKESVGKRMWIAIVLITISSMLISVEDFRKFSFSIGSILVLIACICWGFENNCTRMLSLKNPLQIVIIKGFGSGTGSLLIAFFIKEYTNNITYVVLALFLGFFAYGLSIYFYIMAQRELGAARTSAYYAIAPFMGVALSFIVNNQNITISFITALILMIFGTYFAAVEKHHHYHVHNYIEHEHRHNHQDGHHTHTHDFLVNGEHNHPHIHEESAHSHSHTPDLHHTHVH